MILVSRRRPVLAALVKYGQHLPGCKIGECAVCEEDSRQLAAGERQPGQYHHDDPHVPVDLSCSCGWSTVAEHFHIPATTETP